MEIIYRKPLKQPAILEIVLSLRALVGKKNTIKEVDIIEKIKIYHFLI